MASQEQEIGQIKYLIDKLRSITLAVQIAPFVYSLLFIFCLVMYLFCQEPVIVALDSLFYMSPIAACSFLVFSKVLNLCKWHKCACALPILPQIVVFADRNIIELSEAEAYISIIMPIVLSALLLIAAYNVFFK